MNIIEKRNTIREIINGQHGRMFSAVTIGKDGKEHKFNCRTGVVKYARGGINPIANKDDLVSVFDVQKMGYRTIFLDGVKSINAGHQNMVF